VRFRTAAFNALPSLRARFYEGLLPLTYSIKVGERTTLQGAVLHDAVKGDEVPFVADGTAQRKRIRGTRFGA
jgi:hypothetical protein